MKDIIEFAEEILVPAIAAIPIMVFLIVTAPIWLIPYYIYKIAKKNDKQQ